MIEPALLAGFLLAVLAVQLLPGPDMMLVVARGVGQGRKVALACVAGISAAGFIQVPALAFIIGFTRQPPLFDGGDQFLVRNAV